MEPRTRIGRNLVTCKRGPTLIKLMGYEHREDAVGGGGAGNVKHTHTHTHTQSPPCYTRWIEPRERIGRTLDTCKRGLPTN